MLNYTDTRFKVAKEVSFTICRYLENLDENLRNMLRIFLKICNEWFNNKIIFQDSWVSCA